MTGPSAKAEQAERRAIIKGDQQSAPRPNEPSTMFQMANLNVDTGVTPSRVGKDSYVTGSEKSVSYPASAGPWSSSYGRVPDERPLGYSVEEMVPCGEHFEVARSLASLPATALISADAGRAEEECAVLPVAAATSSATSLISSASAERDQAPKGDGVGPQPVHTRTPSPTFHRPTRRL